MEKPRLASLVLNSSQPFFVLGSSSRSLSAKQNGDVNLNTHGTDRRNRPSRSPTIHQQGAPTPAASPGAPGHVPGRDAEYRADRGECQPRGSRATGCRDCSDKGALRRPFGVCLFPKSCWFRGSCWRTRARCACSDAHECAGRAQVSSVMIFIGYTRQGDYRNPR